PFTEFLRSVAGFEDALQVLRADADAAVLDRQAQRAGLLDQPHAEGRGLCRACVGGVADQIHEQVVQGIGVALEIHGLERGVELERDLLLLQDPALERATGADHAYGVEALGARQGAARPVLYGAQEADRPVDVLDHLTQLVEQLEAAAGRNLGPAAQRFHGELQPGAGRREWVRQLVRDDARERGDVLKRVGPCRRMAGRGLAPVQQAEAEARELERQALPAAP